MKINGTDLNQCKEQFSRAYVHAVASAAGCSIYVPHIDNDSVDIGFVGRGRRRAEWNPHLEAQIKCTANFKAEKSHLHFRLGTVKNNNDLRRKIVSVPRILIVLTVPRNIEEWLAHFDEETILRRCGYWMTLRGMKRTGNKTGVSLQIPLEQRFTPASLQAILSRISTGGLP